MAYVFGTLQAALETLRWNREEVSFVLSGKLFFTPCTDYNATVKKGRTMKFLCANALLVTVGKPSEQYRPDLVITNPITQQLDMPRGQTGITDAALVIMREKGNRFVPCRVSRQTFARDVAIVSCSKGQLPIH